MLMSTAFQGRVLRYYIHEWLPSNFILAHSYAYKTYAEFIRALIDRFIMRIRVLGLILTYSPEAGLIPFHLT